MVYPHLGAFVAILVVGGVVVSADDYVLARHLGTFLAGWFGELRGVKWELKITQTQAEVQGIILKIRKELYRYRSYRVPRI
jgi:hypothetical protein